MPGTRRKGEQDWDQACHSHGVYGQPNIWKWEWELSFPYLSSSFLFLLYYVCENCQNGVEQHLLTGILVPLSWEYPQSRITEATMHSVYWNVYSNELHPVLIKSKSWWPAH